MYLLYIDESGTPDLKKDPERSPNGNNTLFFVLGAVLIHARTLEEIEFEFQKIRNKYFKDKFTEIKYSIKAEKLITGRNIKGYRENIFTTIGNSNISTFGVQQNKHFSFSEGLVSSKDDIYLMSFQHLLSLINTHVFRKQIKDPITVFIDSINHDHDLKIYKAYRLALENQSIFKNFDKQKFSPTINFANSKFTCGLQLADLVSGALWRGLEIGDKQYSKSIKKRFPCADNGNPLDYGYKICTDWLIRK